MNETLDSLDDLVGRLHTKVAELSAAWAVADEDSREWDYLQGLVDAYSVALFMAEAVATTVKEVK